MSPTSAESSFWNGDNTITIQSGTDAVANVLYLGNTNLTSSSLTLAEEGSLTLSGATRIADAADANFYLNLYGDFIGTTMFVGGVNTTDTEGEAQVTIGGGSFKLSSFIQFSLGTGSNINRLVVDGSSASLIEAEQIQVAGSGNQPGEIQFDFDADGVTPISLVGSFFGASDFDIVVNGENYTGDSATFKLIDTDTGMSGTSSIYGGDFNSIEVLGFTGYETTISVVDGDLVLTLERKQILVPLEISEFSIEEDEISLSWRSNPGETYSVNFSLDLESFEGDLEESINAAETGNLTKFVFPVASLPGKPQKIFFRVERN